MRAQVSGKSERRFFRRPPTADELERVYGVRPKAGDNMLDLLSAWPEHREQVRTG